EQPGRLDLGRDVGDRLLDALLVEQRAALVGLGLEVLERPLVRRLRDAEGRGPDERARALERRQRVGRARLLARARALELLVELVHPAEQVLDRDAAVLEDDLGGLRGADAELALLLALAQARRAL